MRQQDWEEAVDKSIGVIETTHGSVGNIEEVSPFDDSKVTHQVAFWWGKHGTAGAKNKNSTVSCACVMSMMCVPALYFEHDTMQNITCMFAQWALRTPVLVHYVYSK